MKQTISLILILLVFTSCEQSKKTEQSETQPKTEERKRGPGGRGNYTQDMTKRLEGDPFVGIVTSNGKEEGLFPIKSTGVSTEPIVKSAQAFLNGLNNEQKETLTFDIDADQWRIWSNVDVGIFKRNGLPIKEMTQDQRKLAFQFLADALSAKGLQLSKDIMKTDQTLKELNNGSDSFDEELYYFTIFGEPSTENPWGFQLNGHHLAIHYFVLGDQVVMTPTFMGGEPIITTSGKYKGNSIFQDEQNIGLQFMQSLPVDQQAKATLSSSKTKDNMKSAAFLDNMTLDYQGLKASDLSAEKQAELLQLAALYINNMREGHAKVKLDEVKAHLDETYFAWIGPTTEDAVFYYRIHSPVVLIEFDHQNPVGIRGERKPTRNHIHTMVRTPNGNDYGKDYLRQHIEEHH